MFCTNCGAKNDDIARFCTSCGTPITKTQDVPAQPVQQHSSTPPAPAPASFSYAAPPEKLEVWMWIICILIPIVGLIMFFVWRTEKPAKSQQAIIAGGIGMLVNLLYFM